MIAKDKGFPWKIIDDYKKKRLLTTIKRRKETPPTGILKVLGINKNDTSQQNL